MRVALWVLLAGVAWADLDPRSTEWNGLSRWVSGLEQGPIEVHTPRAVSLLDLAPVGGLALVGAEAVEDPAGLRRWVERGGRLLVAVEGTEADGLLRLFDAHATPAPAGGRRLGGHPALRVLAGPGRGRLFRGVRHLVTNRPHGLQAADHLRAQIRYDDGTAFAYHLKLGAGEALLLGDASLLINQMLDAGDNARLAANVGAWLARDGKSPVYVVGPSGRITGRAPLSGSGPETGTVAAINRALAQLANHAAPDTPAVFILLALLLLACITYLVTVFPGGRTETSPGAPPLDAAGQVARAAGQPGGPADPD